MLGGYWALFDCKRTSSLLATVLNIRSLEVTWTETLAATLQAADNNQLFTRSRYLYRLQQLQQTMHSLQQQLPRHPVACNESCKWTHRTLRTEQLWRPQWTRSSTAVRAHETHVEFQNHRGEKLIGTLTEPDTQTSQNPSTPAPKPPVVILAHGYMSTRNSELLVRLATALTNSFQLSSLRFDFSGNGDSEGQFRYGQYRSEAEELRCAKGFLEQQLGRQVVAMIGHSKGATDVLLYTAKYDDVPCVVNLAGRFELQKGVLERLGPEVLQQLERQGQVEMSGRSSKGTFTWYLKQEDLDDRLSTDMAAACAAIRRTAVLTVHGDADADVPVKDAHKIAAAVQGPHELVIIEGGDHCFTSQGAMYQLAAAVLPFVSRHANVALSR